QRPDGTLVPWLAKSWTVSEDGLAYTFELRRDVTFSDGTRFDAAAVKANLDHVVAPETASKLAASLIGPYDRTETPDDFTAVIHLKKPYSSLLRALSTTYLGMQSPLSMRQSTRLNSSHVKVSSADIWLQHAEAARLQRTHL